MKASSFPLTRARDWLATALRLPPLLLALLLHSAPLAKFVQPSAAPLFAAAPAAIIFKWFTAAVAVAGACHAVSGASTYISGLTRYTNLTSQGVVSNSLTFTPVGTNGSQFLWRITVVGAGSDIAGDFFNCYPLPPGLGINTNFGGKGFVTNFGPGFVMTPGVYPVTLVAGNSNCTGCIVSNSAVITIVGPGSPPMITGPPAGQTVFAGATANFGVTHNGTAPFTYQWRKNGGALAGQVASNLSLPNVTTNDTAGYTVVVSNSFGAATSAPPAQLGVVGLPELAVDATNGLVRLQLDQYPNASYTVQYQGGLASNDWLTLTNLAPAGAVLRPSVFDAFNPTNRFYRARVTIP